MAKTRPFYIKQKKNDREEEQRDRNRDGNREISLPVDAVWTCSLQVLGWQV